MGWSFRKSFRIAKGVRVNFSRRGVSWSIGTKLMRFLFSRGRTRISSGVGPFRYEKSIGGGSGGVGRGVSGLLKLVFVVTAIGFAGLLFNGLQSPPKKAAKLPADDRQLERPAIVESMPPRAALKLDPVPPALEREPAGNIQPAVRASRKAPTGHAAEAAKWRAVAQFPHLGIEGSALNRAFIAKVRKYEGERPEVFDDVEWPTVIAKECVAELGPR